MWVLNLFQLDYQCSLLHCASQTLIAVKRCSTVEVSKESSLALFAVLLNLKGNSQSIELSALTKGNFCCKNLIKILILFWLS